VAITGHVAVEAGDGFFSGLTGAFLLFGVVGDGDCTATYAAARYSAGCFARDVKTAITGLDAVTTDNSHTI
ncbi:hypothetical protein, partial [Pseudomonas petrae]